MKLFYDLVIFCVVSQIVCGDLHHVEGRNMEDDLEEFAEPPVSNEIPEVTNINTTDGTQNSTTSIINVTSELTPETTTKFNVSTLLRGEPRPELYLINMENDSNKIEQSNKSSNGNDTLIDTEVPSLLNVSIRVNLYQQPLQNENPVKVSNKINDDTELIENGQNTEDDLRTHRDILTDDIIPQQRYLAVIVACTLTIVAIICYVSLWSWRRYLERRYGSRTMLVNAEEFDDPNDIHHFTI